METVLLACSFAAFALAVGGTPTYVETEEPQMRQHPENYQYLRETRSQYAPQYITPCAAAAGPINVPAYSSPYHLNLPNYAVPHYGYGASPYRSVDEQMVAPETLGFSDMDQRQHGHAMMMDHIPMARTAYGGPLQSGLALNGPVLTPVGGPAYGIFPNANVGRCNVPLLFSCSPSISSGRIIESHPYLPSGVPIHSGNSYRLVEQQHHHDLHEHSEEMPDQHIEPVHHTSHAAQSHR